MATMKPPAKIPSAVADFIELSDISIAILSCQPYHAEQIFRAVPFTTRVVWYISADEIVASIYYLL